MGKVKLPFGIITPEFVQEKIVILRADIDAITEIGGLEEYRLVAGLETLNLCLEHAKQVIMIGHVGRPGGKVVEELKVAPVVDWFKSQGYSGSLESGKLKILENLRFDPREEACDLGYARELKKMGDVYVNEAFASYRPAVSTTILPTLLPSVAGLRFGEEVERLTAVRRNPEKPCIAIMGGAKVNDKLPVIRALATKVNYVLVGGKLVQEIRTQKLNLPENVMVGGLSEDGLDIMPETTQAWKGLISQAKTIIWNGPVGRFEEAGNDQTEIVARMILGTEATIVIGGGNTIDALNHYGLLEEAERKAFVSVGGGAMLEFLEKGTLPTIEALKKSNE